MQLNLFSLLVFRPNIKHFVKATLAVNPLLVSLCCFAAPIICQVVDSNGLPVQGVTVSFDFALHDPNSQITGIGSTFVSDGSGNMTIPDPPTADFPSHPSVPSDINLQSASKDGYIKISGGEVTKIGDSLIISPIVMAKLDAEVDGVIKNGLGKPVTDAWVVCPQSSETSMPVQTDSTGHFKLTGLVEGAVEIYAAKGNYEGHKYAQTAPTPLTVNLTLEPASPLPTPSDVAKGVELMETAQGNSDSDQNFLLGICALQVAVADLNAGINLYKSHAPLTMSSLGEILYGREQFDPVDAATIGLPLMQSLPDDGSLPGAALPLGLAVVSIDPKLASTLYVLGSKDVNMDRLGSQNLRDGAQLAVLATLLKAPDAKGLVDKVASAVSIVMANSKPDANGNSPDSWIAGSVAQILSQVDPKITVQILKGLDTNSRLNAVRQVLSQMSSRPGDDSIAIYELLDAEKDEPGYSFFDDSCTKYVIPALYKKDPKQATDKANSVTDPAMRSEALTVLADQTPIQSAGAVYKQAITVNPATLGQGCSPAFVAFHGWLRDKPLGKELFQMAYDKVVNSKNTLQPGDYQQAPPYADFAFYYSKVDPGFCRVFLEKIYLSDLNPSTQSRFGGSVGKDALAMAALDVDRADAMTASIDNEDIRFYYYLKIAQYLLASQKVRDSIPFPRWAATDTWTPGTPTGW